MRLTLNYTPPAGETPISHRHRLVLAGSCFAENIGELLHRYYFRCTVNPGGIIFDALSLALYLRSGFSEAEADPHLLERGGRFFSYRYHSSVSAGSETEMLSKHKEILEKSRTALVNADFLVLTLGTAFTHFHAGTNIAATNCHKQPGAQFRKQLLTVGEIVEAYCDTIATIRQVNKKVQVILTVSPVKYLKDGPVNNNLSKSTLLLAVHELVKRLPGCHYFPAYELVTDDLRDYRFYKEDFAHPNELAIKYVWEKFSDAWFSAETKNLNTEIEKLNSATSHHIIHPHPEENEKLEAYVLRQRQLIKQLEPSIEFR